MIFKTGFEDQLNDISIFEKCVLIYHAELNVLFGAEDSLVFPYVIEEYFAVKPTLQCSLYVHDAEQEMEDV